MQPITVTIERPMVIQDQTSSLRIVTNEEVQHLPTRGYQDIVGLQTGAVRYQDNPGSRFRGDRENTNTGLINLRGGRASEVAYYVDGFSQQDPLTGLSTSQINNSSIEEVSVVTGGFNAEYGLIMSGAVNVTTKGGSRTSEYHGSLEGITDNFHGDKYDYNVYSGTLNGPLLPGRDNLSFYLAGERRWQGDREPHATAGGPLDHNSAGMWNYQGKLNWQAGDNTEFRLGSIGSYEKWDEYDNFYKFVPEHAPRYQDENYSFWGTLTQTLSPKTFFTVSGSWFSTERIRGDATHFDDIWGYGRPGDGNPSNESADLFRSWDNLNIDDDGNQIITETYDSVMTVPMFKDLNNNKVIDEGEKVYLDGEPIEQSFTFNFERTDSVVVDEDGKEVKYTTIFGDEGHVWEDLLKRKSSYIGGDFDLVSQVHPSHEVKAGLEFQRHTLRFYNHYFPNRIYLGAKGGFDDINSYGYDVLGQETDDDLGLNGAKNPVNGAAYLQDKFEWEGLVVNAGLRFDYFDYKTKRLRDPENPLDPDGYSTLPDPTDEQLVEANRLTESDLLDSESESRVSPRLGVAFPVADGSVLHFSYGKFFQRPDLQNLYVNYDFLEFKVKTGGYYVAFGNPNLEPEETTAYEVGWRRQVSPFAVVDLTLFYKDIKNLTEVVNQPAAPSNFSTFRNRDYGTVQGLEFQFDMRRNRSISTQVNYTLQFSEGTGSFANTQSNVAWTVSTPPKNLSALDFDQRHKLTAIVDIRAGAKEGPKLGDFFLLENTGVNFTANAGSGFPYTPSQVFNEVTLGNASPVSDGKINSKRGPWTFRIDMKANRTIKVGGNELDVYLWVLNLLDRENVIDVYESSGLADRTSWLETPSGQQFIANNSEPTDVSGLTGEQKYQIAQANPLNYDTPRQIRLGVRYLF
jgi:outer membrane receptor protein involved in Fe transport